MTGQLCNPRGMRIFGTIVISAAFGCTSAGAEEKKPEIVRFTGGQYMIYGGGLGDVYPPKAGDAKLYLELGGEAARQIFDRLGRASEKKECAEQGEIFRRKGDVACTRSRRNTYSCQLGFDLTTGKSTNASIC